MADYRNQSMRVRDADRVDACALLDNAKAEGELTEAEHARRTAAAMEARTFGDLDKLIDDLQIPANLVGTALLRPQRRDDLRRWKIAIAALCVATVVGALGGCIARNTVSKPDMPDATTGAGFASFVAAYRDHFGDTTVDQVTIFPDRVSIQRPSTKEGREDYYNYDGSFRGSSDTARSSSVQSLDLSTIDLPKLAGLIAGGAASAGLPGVPVSHISIERRTGEDPAISIYTTQGSRTGYLVVSMQGEPLMVNVAK
ncbi:DUF1707 domain-containing protein [Nocardia sp. NPDC056000]|uniref:DUF1707 SHOCT-like domain-containing protein n=1 Tax=Nocardia sp. NPDC056000 TaxID=3345674 RepID=UPI0035E3407B